MSTFNFGSLATTQPTSSIQQYLKPWDIYTVKFSGARVENIAGKKDPNATYTILKVRFDGEDGYYEESIFFPQPGDEVRPEKTASDGHKYFTPSKFDRSMMFIAQVAGVLNPEGFKKLQAASVKFKSFDDVVKGFIQVTDVAKGKETKLKLVGYTDKNGKVQTSLPRFVAINTQGEPFCCDNFLGDKLFFSAYEEGKKAEYLNAKPTTMPKNNDIDGTSTTDDDIDFEDLLS